MKWTFIHYETEPPLCIRRTKSAGDVSSQEPLPAETELKKRKQDDSAKSEKEVASDDKDTKKRKVASESQGQGEDKEEDREEDHLSRASAAHDGGNQRRSPSRKDRNPEHTPEERSAKRKRYIECIKDTPGYREYRAKREKGDKEAIAAPRTPDAVDEKIPKRKWEEFCREWRRSLKQWGDIPYEFRQREHLEDTVG